MEHYRVFENIYTLQRSIRTFRYHFFLFALKKIFEHTYTHIDAHVYEHLYRVI